jgi:serine/threonine-protein phosphatase 2B regulatory subunit
MLKASLFENCMLELSEKQMKALVDHTFFEADTNGDGKISFEEYKDMVMKHPRIVENLTIKSSSFLDIKEGVN